MPSPGLIGRKAPPGQGPIATKRLDMQIKLLLSIAAMIGFALMFVVGAFLWIRARVIGAPEVDLLFVVWPAICLVLGGFSIPSLRRKLSDLRALELAERETASG